MSSGFTNVSLKNYRCLADVSVDLGDVNVVFGPNGAGKSTFLDGIWFFRDCAMRGVETASSQRNHGIGLLYDGAEDDARISVTLSTSEMSYEVDVGLSSGRIEPFAGENLRSNKRGMAVIERRQGGDQASLYNSLAMQSILVPLREPEKLSMGLYLDFNPTVVDTEATNFDRLLRFVRMFHTRSFNFHSLKLRGSEANYEVRLWERGENAWSVLRNLHDRKSVDSRFDSIVRFMREGFPSFDGIVFEQTGPQTVYAKFLEKGRRHPINASGVSDGHLQMLLLLTALFSEDPNRESVLMFDEPEISLHPWALTVLAKAMREATQISNRQVLIITHSPALISQFQPNQILSAELTDGRTTFQRVDKIGGIQDLLECYETGSLYMAQAVGAQSSVDPE